MRLAQPIETSGSFWLPGDTENRVAGVLRISQSGEATIEVSGVPHHPIFTPQDAEPIRVFGMVDKPGSVTTNGFVTLDGCIRQPMVSGWPFGMSKAGFDIDVVFVGIIYGDQEESGFSELSLYVEELGDWLDTPGIYTEFDMVGRSGSIRYHHPPGIKVDLPEEIRLEFRLELTPSVASSASTKTASVSQTACVHLTPEDPQPIEYFLPLAVRLCGFLSLALDRTVSVQKIIGEDEILDARTGEAFPISVEVYGQFAPWSHSPPSTHSHEVMFRYPDVSSQLDDLLTKWLINYEKFKHAINLYFASRTDALQSPETRFLWLAQGLETFHRRSSRETAMPEEEFERRKASILDSCPEEWREWLDHELGFSNELSLGSRLRKLISPFQKQFGNAATRNSFVNEIVVTRNYFTHYDHRLEDQAARGEDLVKLYQKLEALFRLHLLRLIGLDGGTIDLMVQNNARFRRSIGLAEVD